jgi:hypothetical protein
MCVADGIGERETVHAPAIHRTHRDPPEKNYPATAEFFAPNFIFRSPSTTVARGGAMLTIVVCTATANR